MLSSRWAHRARPAGNDRLKTAIKIRPALSLPTSLYVDVLNGEHIGKGHAVSDPSYAVSVVKRFYDLEAAAQVPKESVAYADPGANVEHGRGSTFCLERTLRLRLVHKHLPGPLKSFDTRGNRL